MMLRRVQCVLDATRCWPLLACLRTKKLRRLGQGPLEGPIICGACGSTRNRIPARYHGSQATRPLAGCSRARDERGREAPIICPPEPAQCEIGAAGASRLLFQGGQSPCPHVKSAKSSSSSSFEWSRNWKREEKERVRAAKAKKEERLRRLRASRPKRRRRDDDDDCDDAGGARPAADDANDARAAAEPRTLLVRLVLPRRGHTRPPVLHRHRDAAACDEGGMARPLLSRKPTRQAPVERADARAPVPPRAAVRVPPEPGPNDIGPTSVRYRLAARRTGTG